MVRLLIAFALCIAAVSACLASDGVLIEERVVNLPQDQEKWYISIVGDSDTRFNEIAGWFDTNDDLKRLKAQVKFCKVTSGTAVYQERYAPNVCGLPTVRMQKADGTVVYEASGKSIPMTPESLYSAMASTQGIRPFMPWRREMERRCPCPRPEPTPVPTPDTDPVPDPIDDGGAPDLAAPDEQSGLAKIIGLCALSLLGGAVGGGVIQWKKTYAVK